MPKKSTEIKDVVKKQPAKIKNLKLMKLKKSNENDGDSDSDSEYETEYDTEYETEYDTESDSNSDIEIEVDVSKGKYMKKNVISKNNNSNNSNKNNKNETKILTRSQTKKQNKNKNNNKNQKKYIDISTDSNSDNDEDEDDDEDDEDFNFSKSNYNIFFTIKNDKYDDYDYEDEEESDTENEDDDISSSEDDDEESETKEEDNTAINLKKNKLNKPNKNNKLNNNKLNNNKLNNNKLSNNPKKNKYVLNNIDENNENNENNKNNKNNNKDDDDDDDEDEEDCIVELLEKLNYKKSSSLVSECISLCKGKIAETKKKKEKKNKKEKERNIRIFERIMYDKNTMNDVTFFNKLDLQEQKKIIKELREINKIIRSEKPYRLTLLESNIPTFFKAVAMKKISLMRNMNLDNGEYYKIKNWVDTFMRIPFGIYKTLPITITNGIDDCTQFMEKSRQILDDAVYGLNDAKMQIMQLLGQLITNPSAVGSAIGIQGSPGVGKTNLAREGISKILGRPFAFIALGGATDSSFLEGHSYTYEGSSWGKIVQILIDSKCMNPVIYFDELDKVSDTPKGEEIIGILTHLIDTSQNGQFHDKYFSEIDFDLSKCLFIFTYNDESKLNPILKDRMYKIQIKNYDRKEKTIIANNYLLPKIRDQVKFNFEDISITDEIIHYIVDTYCDKEDGVRNLKRCLEIIHTKLNLCRLVKPGSSFFEENSVTNVEFPLIVTKDIVDKLIKRKDIVNPSLYHMYI